MTIIDMNGNGAIATDSQDIVTQTYYDKAGNVISTKDPEGHYNQTIYDGAGRVVSQIANLDDNRVYRL